jgi:hypothetical protein
MIDGGTLTRIANLYYTTSLPVKSKAPGVQEGSSTYLLIYARRGFTGQVLLLLK